MSSESFEVDNNSSTEDIELKDFSRRSDGNYDSCSSADITASSRGSMKNSDTDESKVSDVSLSYLNTSDENHHEFDIRQNRRSSLKGKTRGYLTETKRSGWHAHTSTPKASFLEESTIRKVSSLSSLERSATGKASSLTFQEETSTRRVSSLNTLRESSIRKISSLKSLDGPSTTKVSSLDSLERSSTGRVSSLNPLKGSSIRKVWSLDGLGGPPTNMFSSLDTLKKSSTRKVSSLNSLDGTSTRKVSSLDFLKKPAIGKDSSGDPLERPAIGKDSSAYPLECPSTKTACFPVPAESSLPINYRSQNSETETSESLNSDPAIVRNGCCIALAWLCYFSKRIKLSMCYFLFHVALLAVSCSAIYMGTKYYKRCDGCPKLPLLVYSMGVLGTLFLIFRIAAIVSKLFFSPPLSGGEFYIGSVPIGLLSSMCLLAETTTVFSCTPGFIPYRENFCHEIFYNYTYYVNVIMLFIIVLLILIHTLGNFAPAEYE